MRRAADPDAALRLETLDHLGQLAVVDRQRRLGLERLDEVVPLVALVARAEQGHHFAPKVAAQLALMSRLATEQVEVDQTRQRVGLQEVSIALALATKSDRSVGNAQPIPSGLRG